MLIFFNGKIYFTFIIMVEESVWVADETNQDNDNQNSDKKWSTEFEYSPMNWEEYKSFCSWLYADIKKDRKRKWMDIDLTTKMYREYNIYIELVSYIYSIIRDLPTKKIKSYKHGITREVEIKEDISKVQKEFNLTLIQVLVIVIHISEYSNYLQPLEKLEDINKVRFTYVELYKTKMWLKKDHSISYKIDKWWELPKQIESNIMKFESITYTKNKIVKPKDWNLNFTYDKENIIRSKYNSNISKDNTLHKYLYLYSFAKTNWNNKLLNSIIINSIENFLNASFDQNMLSSIVDSLAYTNITISCLNNPKYNWTLRNINNENIFEIAKTTEKKLKNKDLKFRKEIYPYIIMTRDSVINSYLEHLKQHKANNLKRNDIEIIIDSLGQFQKNTPNDFKNHRYSFLKYLNFEIQNILEIVI